MDALNAKNTKFLDNRWYIKLLGCRFVGGQRIFTLYFNKIQNNLLIPI